MSPVWPMLGTVWSSWIWIFPFLVTGCDVDEEVPTPFFLVNRVVVEAALVVGR